jgi:choline dehydrogenase-like flavoprotein
MSAIETSRVAVTGPEIWDYIVVGAGSSGCAVARRLADSGQKSVLLLEAGPHDRSLAVTLPCGAGLFDITRFDWGYYAAQDVTRHNKREHWVCGHVLGGSSSINGMNYVRGSASDYARWAASGNRGWEPEQVMALYRSMERCDSSIADPVGIRGREGPVRVRMVSSPHSLTTAFIAAAQAAGHPFNPDYNGSDQEGVAFTQLTQYRGTRWSAADAYLHSSDAANLKWIVGAFVLKVLIKEQRAYGVLFESGGAVHEARAQHVVLCGGAINTPKLLMLSGIGDSAELARHGIETIVHRKAVGQHLMEHPVIRLVYRVNVPTYNPRGSVLHKLSLFGKYLFKRQGPLASAIEGMAFLRTSASEREPDIQLHFAPLGLDDEATGNDQPTDSRKQIVHVLSCPSMTVWINKSHPLSRGRVALSAGDPKAPPLIEPRIFANDADLATLVRAIGTVRRIMANEPIANLITEELRPGPRYSQANALADYVRANAALAYHPAGTCRMGADDESVVTPDLQVRGIDNLWVADASILPDLISGNTNAVCMLIGEKLGRSLAAGAGSTLYQESTRRASAA